MTASWNTRIAACDVFTPWEARKNDKLVTLRAALAAKTRECRSVGSSLASAIGGTLLTSSLVFADGRAFPSRSAYLVLFAICAGAAALGAVIALTVPAHQDASGTVSVRANRATQGDPAGEGAD